MKASERKTLYSATTIKPYSALTAVERQRKKKRLIKKIEKVVVKDKIKNRGALGRNTQYFSNIRSFLISDRKEMASAIFAAQRDIKAIEEKYQPVADVRD